MNKHSQQSSLKMEDLKMVPLIFKKDKKDGFTTWFNPHGDLEACFSAFARGLMAAVEPYTHEGIFVAKSKEHGHVLATEDLLQLDVQKEDGSKRGLKFLNPFHLKLAAAIYAGIHKTWIKPGARVLYLGACSGKGRTVFHVSDIVGPAGVVYAVEISEISYCRLMRKARKYTNIVPIFEDARHPDKYRNSVGMVDVILCDVAQPDQASILGLNASYCLKADGHFVISVKASCIDSTVSATSVFVDEVVKLCSHGFVDLELATLEPFKHDHACVVGAFMKGDDFESGKEEAVDIEGMDVYKQKLTRRINHFKIELQNPCRKGKKLLVLDIDYTIFDHRSIAENHLQLMRPYLHEFLTSVYSEYDIMIWSATSMKLIEVKMGQLGVLDNPNYKITALLDHLAMYTVQSISRGVFTCKPLGLIWAQFPEFYNASNTIMFDDLERNFMMNPQNGLTIKPFRKAHVNRDSDQELVKLTQYLLAIAELDDLSKLDHNNWELFTEDNAKCAEESGCQDAAS